MFTIVDLCVLGNESQEEGLEPGWLVNSFSGALLTQISRG